MKKMNELEKWNKIHDDSLIINEFIEFLSSKGYSIENIQGEYGYVKIGPVPNSQDLIYQFFGIDPIKLEKERRELLESLH